jgi:hypothetical protein
MKNKGTKKWMHNKITGNKENKKTRANKSEDNEKGKDQQ